MIGGKPFEAIAIGDSASLVKRITEADVARFVELTGDDNPLHVDRAYAEATPFKDIVVHGLLGASFISTLIGTKLPGEGALWVSQAFEFLLPVRLGDELTISVTVRAKHERERLLELETTIVNQARQLVLSGQGKVKLLEPRPAAIPQAEPTRVAIVTGGAGGIGRAICQRLAADGFKVVLAYHTNQARAGAVVAEIAEAGGTALALEADVSSPDQVLALVEAATRRFGAVTTLVNNASPRIAPGTFEALAWSDVTQHLDVQLKGAFQLAKAVVPGMKALGHGRIINITSQASDAAPPPGWTAYAVAKSALATFARSLAVELGPHGITVNNVSPGMTDTALIGDIPEKARLVVARQTPTRRLAEPRDVASAVAFLASHEAAHITGETLRVNGGTVMA
ncbi:MAG: MaoC domain protein dehydratase [Cyanobacteria bacterium RYN_339]|nr:MaoC domain protein dehydratase [Cyanobacteria bacterium RYN_339]